MGDGVDVGVRDRLGAIVPVDVPVDDVVGSAWDWVPLADAPALSAWVPLGAADSEALPVADVDPVAVWLPDPL